MKEIETKTNHEATMERAEFMKRVGLSIGAVLLMNCTQSCSDGEIPDPNPPTNNTGKVDMTININDATYAALQTPGRAVVIKSPGIIVARDLNNNWIALASACTHEGTEISYRANSNDFLCPNHGSTFNTTGAVTKAPATKALKKYSTSFTANSGALRIFE